MAKRLFAAIFVLSLLASTPNLSAADDETSVVTQVTEGVTKAAQTAWDWTGGFAWNTVSTHPKYSAGIAVASLVLVHFADDLGIELPEWLENLCPCTTKKAKKTKKAKA